MICNIMERMVTDQLVHRLEQGNFSPFQSGFKLGRATVDPVLMLDKGLRKL